MNTVGTKTIGLCMIVRNEAHVIERSLNSVRPLVDFVLVEDTGSSDDTQQLIKDWLKRENLPGAVYHEPWQNFAYNRSNVLATLRKKHPDLDYALMMDADDQLVVHEGFDAEAFKQGLEMDVYNVEIRQGTTSYIRLQMCSNHKPFRYRSVLHEYLHRPPGVGPAGTAKGFHVISGREGARNKDARKYHKDAEVLERALRHEQDDFLRTRYVFYLAQSYRDAGEKEKALANYIKRSQMGRWQEEVYVSLYNAAKLEEALKWPFDAVLSAYKNAAKALPSRTEALHGGSRLCRLAKRYEDGYELAKRGLAIDKVPEGLFIEHWIYDYGLLDEFAVNAYWAEEYEDCLQACERLMAEGKMPADMRERVEKNAEYAKQKLAERSSQTPRLVSN